MWLRLTLYDPCIQSSNDKLWLMNRKMKKKKKHTHKNYKVIVVIGCTLSLNEGQTQKNRATTFFLGEFRMFHTLSTLKQAYFQWYFMYQCYSLPPPQCTPCMESTLWSWPQLISTKRFPTPAIHHPKQLQLSYHLSSPTLDIIWC